MIDAEIANTNAMLNAQKAVHQHYFSVLIPSHMTPQKSVALRRQVLLAFWLLIVSYTLLH
jgi:hypothetical protein